MAYPNLIAEMKRQGITPKAIAEVVDKSPDTINNWLKGKGEFPIGKAFAVQEKFFPHSPDLLLIQPEAHHPTGVRQVGSLIHTKGAKPMKKQFFINEIPVSRVTFQWTVWSEKATAATGWRPRNSHLANSRTAWPTA
jgi:transcriptional regulator with XRE-family HTH domain